MPRGKTPSEENKPEPAPAPEKKPDSTGDPLAELIDTYGEEVEPVAPEDGTAEDPRSGPTETS